MENEIRKIGFKRQDERVASNDVSSVPAPVEENNEKTFPISSAQADLIETINSLAEIIVDKGFAKYNENQRTNFVNTLIHSVALNTELTTKTMLLVE